MDSSRSIGGPWDPSRAHPTTHHRASRRVASPWFGLWTHALLCWTWTAGRGIDIGPGPTSFPFHQHQRTDDHPQPPTTTHATHRCHFRGPRARGTAALARRTAPGPGAAHRTGPWRRPCCLPACLVLLAPSASGYSSCRLSCVGVTSPTTRPGRTELSAFYTGMLRSVVGEPAGPDDGSGVWSGSFIQGGVGGQMTGLPLWFR
jgi:hypothetical protein